MLNLLRKFRRSNPLHAAAPRPVEPLEHRLLLAAVPSPRVVTAVADNRGQVIFTLNQPLDPATVNNRSVQILQNGRSIPATISYNRAYRQITATATKLPANAAFSVRLIAARIRNTTGQILDGEYHGAAVRSGNGKAGGDYIAKTQRTAPAVARFSTNLGLIDVKLFTAQTPKTVQNFLAYANEGKWDKTFFHRSVPNFVIQGGGFTTATGSVQPIAQKPAVVNEPHPNDPGNIRGTIAMAKIGGDPNSATNQWFFSEKDNRTILDGQNGGFTVFGKIANARGLAVMDRIAKKGIIDANAANDPQGPFGEIPVMDVDRIRNTGVITPSRDLIIIQRVAILTRFAPPPAQG